MGCVARPTARSTGRFARPAIPGSTGSRLRAVGDGAKTTGPVRGVPSSLPGQPVQRLQSCRSPPAGPRASRPEPMLHDPLIPAIRVFHPGGQEAEAPSRSEGPPDRAWRVARRGRLQQCERKTGFGDTPLVTRSALPPGPGQYRKSCLAHSWERCRSSERWLCWSLAWKRVMQQWCGRVAGGLPRPPSHSLFRNPVVRDH